MHQRPQLFGFLPLVSRLFAISGGFDASEAFAAPSRRNSLRVAGKTDRVPSDASMTTTLFPQQRNPVAMIPCGMEPSEENGFASQIIGDTGQSSESDPSARARLVRATPCVRLCRYHADLCGGQVCVGCFRDGFEIGGWAGFDAATRTITLEDALARRDAMDPQPSGGSGGAIDETGLFPGSISREELQDMIQYYKEMLI